MRRILAWSVIGILAFTGVRSSFALGEGIGGHGYVTVPAGGAGRNTDDQLHSLGTTYGIHTGGVGMSNTTAAPSTNSSTDQNNQTTGGGPPLVSGKGYSATTARGRGFFVPTVRGVGITSAIPGGRGL